MNGQDSNAEIFDVLLCHNSEDKPAVREIAQMLVRSGSSQSIREAGVSRHSGGLIFSQNNAKSALDARESSLRRFPRRFAASEATDLGHHRPKARTCGRGSGLLDYDRPKVNQSAPKPVDQKVVSGGQLQEAAQQ